MDRGWSARWVSLDSVSIQMDVMVFNTDSAKLLGRTQGRKVSKAESSVDESFEDLLSKYKQIQLELEVIRKEESMALVPKEPPAHAPSPPTGIAGSQVAGEAASEMAEEGPEIKVFQAFNIKPLRQKLPTPARLDRSREEEEQEEEVGGEWRPGT